MIGSCQISGVKLEDLSTIYEHVQAEGLAITELALERGVISNRDAASSLAGFIVVPSNASMISVKYAIIMAVVAFVAGSFSASPLPQAIAAVIASDVQCTGCVGTTDVAGNAITAAKIKDGEVKAAEIAADAVGGSELQGVAKLLFGQCAADSTEGTSNISPGNGILIRCSINGVDSDDSAIAQVDSYGNCFEATASGMNTNEVDVVLMNECTTMQQFGTGSKIGLVVFDK